jgi:hypothetical protein
VSRADTVALGDKSVDVETDLGIACATVAFLKVNILHANRPSITPAGSAPFVSGDFAGLDVNALALPGVGRYLRRRLRWIDSVGSDCLHDEAVGKSRDRNLEVTIWDLQFEVVSGGLPPTDTDVALYFGASGIIRFINSSNKGTVNAVSPCPGL